MALSLQGAPKADKEKEKETKGAVAIFKKVGGTLLTAGGTLVDISQSIGGLVGGI